MGGCCFTAAWFCLGHLASFCPAYPSEHPRLARLEQTLEFAATRSQEKIILRPCKAQTIFWKKARRPKIKTHPKTKHPKIKKSFKKSKLKPTTSPSFQKPLRGPPRTRLRTRRPAFPRRLGGVEIQKGVLPPLGRWDGISSRTLEHRGKLL